MTGTAPENHRDNPYFGLSPFGQKDNEWFFGRDADTDRVVTNLLASRLTLLHAETGVGKSSLLRAGVARRLEAAALTASRRRACVYLPVVFQSWRDDPVGELIGDIASAVAKVANDGGVPVREEEHLDRAIEAGVGDSNTVLLVILDQFEEYFHYAPFEQGGSGRFAEELARCVNRPEVPASFLISIRQDAYASLGNLLEGRIANVYGNYLRIDPLDREAAESAIRGPLDVFNEQEGMPRMTIEKELVAAILDQAQLPNGLAAAPEGTPCENGSIATPVLQLAMDAVWRHERDAGSTTLRLATLEELSRDGQSVVGGFLRHKMAVLDDRKYGVAIDALDHMVTPDGGKIAVSAAQLAPRIRHSERLINGVLGQLAEEGVLRSVAPPPGAGPSASNRYEIFHDVLAAPINRAIAVETERRAAEQRRIDAEKDSRLRRFRRTAQTYRALTGAASLLLVAAIALAVFALSQRNQAVDNLNTVRSLELASAAQALAKNPRRSTQLALEALSIRRTSQAEAALRAGVGALGPVFTGDTGTVNTAVFSPDGRTILTASSDGTARLRDVSHRRLLAVLHAGSAALASAAFSPDGRMVVTAGADGVARIWSALSGHLLRAVAVKRVPGRSGPGEAPAALTDAQFSPEGNEVVTAAADGSARFWDTGSGRQIGAPLDAASGALNSASFSPDGRLIVTAGADGVAKIWTVASHQQFGRQLVGGGGAINQAEFSPSGRYIVTAGTDDTARVWSVGSQRQVAFPLISGGTVYSAAFSPDEHFIATTSADNTVRIWREGNGTQPTILRGSVDDATFDPKGTRLVMAGLDQKVRVSGATIPVLTGPLTTLERVARGLL